MPTGPSPSGSPCNNSPSCSADEQEPAKAQQSQENNGVHGYLGGERDSCRVLDICCRYLIWDEFMWGNMAQFCPWQKPVCRKIQATTPILPCGLWGGPLWSGLSSPCLQSPQILPGHICCIGLAPTETLKLLWFPKHHISWQINQMLPEFLHPQNRPGRLLVPRWLRLHPHLLRAVRTTHGLEEPFQARVVDHQ